jgi:hypothetical protein
MSYFAECAYSLVMHHQNLARHHRRRFAGILEAHDVAPRRIGVAGLADFVASAVVRVDAGDFALRRNRAYRQRRLHIVVARPGNARLPVGLAQVAGETVQRLHVLSGWHPSAQAVKLLRQLVPVLAGVPAHAGQVGSLVSVPAFALAECGGSGSNQFAGYFRSVHSHSKSCALFTRALHNWRLHADPRKRGPVNLFVGRHAVIASK